MEKPFSENRVLETLSNNEIKNSINHEFNQMSNLFLMKSDYTEDLRDDSSLNLQESLKNEYPEYFMSKMISSSEEDFANALRIRLDALEVQVFKEPPDEFEDWMSDRSSLQRLSQISEDAESIESENSDKIKNIKEEIKSIKGEIIEDIEVKHNIENENEAPKIDNQIVETSLKDETNQSANQNDNSSDHVKEIVLTSINNEKLGDSIMTNLNCSEENNKTISENKEPDNNHQDVYCDSEGGSVEDTEFEIESSYVDKERPKTVSNTFEKYKTNVENNNYAKLTMRRLKTAKESVKLNKSVEIVNEETIVLNQTTNIIKPEILRNELKTETDFKLHFAEVSVIDARRKLNQVKYLKSLENFNENSDYVEIDLLNDTNEDYNELEVIKNNQNQLLSKKKSTIRIALPNIIGGKESYKKQPLISKLSTTNSPSKFSSASESKILSKRKNDKKALISSNDIRNNVNSCINFQEKSTRSTTSMASLNQSTKRCSHITYGLNKNKPSKEPTKVFHFDYWQENKEFLYATNYIIKECRICSKYYVFDTSKKVEKKQIKIPWNSKW